MRNLPSAVVLVAALGAPMDSWAERGGNSGRHDQPFASGGSGPISAFENRAQLVKEAGFNPPAGGTQAAGVEFNAQGALRVSDVDAKPRVEHGVHGHGKDTRAESGSSERGTTSGARAEQLAKLFAPWKLVAPSSAEDPSAAPAPLSCNK